MNKLLVSTVIEAIYLIFMYNYFKTTYTFHNPIEMLLNKKVFSDFFKHPMYSGEYESKICRFGNIIGYLLAFWVILRFILNKYYMNLNYKVRTINKIIFILVLIGSILMNFNAFIYYIPVFIYELYFRG
jgi:hypothetical protein